MNRRALLGGFVATAAGLIVPTTLDEPIETVRRYWSLDRTMVAPKFYHIREWAPLPGGHFTLTMGSYTSAPVPYEFKGPTTITFGEDRIVIDGLGDYNALAPYFAALFGQPITVEML